MTNEKKQNASKGNVFMPIIIILGLIIIFYSGYLFGQWLK
jgi:hypothetical protein